MKSNVFVDYILRAKDKASKTFSFAGGKANYYRESMKNASQESFKFGRMQDSVVQPSVAVSTSRIGWMSKVIKGLGLAFVATKAFMLFFRDGMKKTSSTLGEMAHNFSSTNDSLAASAQLTGKSREEVAKYRETMIQTAQEVRNLNIAVGQSDWENALFGLLNAGIRNIDVIRDLSKESMILGKALRIDPEITSKAMAQWKLQLNLSNDSIRELSGSLVYMREQGFKVTEQSITSLDPKMKAFIGRFGPSHLKDIYAIRGALDKYGASHSVLDSILDTSTGSLEAFRGMMIQSGVALSKHDQASLNLALKNGDLETSFKLMMKSMPELIKHLGGAGPAADKLAEAFHISREEALAMSDAIPKVQKDLSKAFQNINNSSKVMNAARKQAIEATQNWRSRLNSIFHSVWDPSIVTMDKFILKMTKLIPASATASIRKFFTDTFNFTDRLVNKTEVLIALWNKSDAKVALLEYWEKFDNKSIAESIGIMFDDINDTVYEFATKSGIEVENYWKKFDNKTVVQSFRKITNDFGTIAITFLRGKGKQFKDWWVEIGKGIDRDNVTSSFDYLYLKIDKLADEYSPKVDAFFDKFKDKTLTQSAVILFDELNAGIDTFITETTPKIQKWWNEIGQSANERDMGGELVHPLFSSLYTSVDDLLAYGPKIAAWWKEFDGSAAIDTIKTAFTGLLGILESTNAILGSIVGYFKDIHEFFTSEDTPKDLPGYIGKRMLSTAFGPLGALGTAATVGTMNAFSDDEPHNNMVTPDIVPTIEKTSKESSFDTKLLADVIGEISNDFTKSSQDTFHSFTSSISRWGDIIGNKIYTTINPGEKELIELQHRSTKLVGPENHSLDLMSIKMGHNLDDINKSLSSSSNDIIESAFSFFQELSHNISHFIVPEVQASIIPLSNGEKSEFRHPNETINNNVNRSIDALNKTMILSSQSKDPEVKITNNIPLDTIVEAIHQSTSVMRELLVYVKKGSSSDGNINQLRYSN